MQKQNSKSTARKQSTAAAAINTLVGKAARSKANAEKTAQPGVIASIMQQLTLAKLHKRPVTVAQLLDVLCKQHPQRKREGMAITVRAQLSRLPDERDFAIAKERHGRVVMYAAK